MVAVALGLFAGYMGFDGAGVLLASVLLVTYRQARRSGWSGISGSQDGWLVFGATLGGALAPCLAYVFHGHVPVQVVEGAIGDLAGRVPAVHQAGLQVSERPRFSFAIGCYFASLAQLLVVLPCDERAGRMAALKASGCLLVGALALFLAVVGAIYFDMFQLWSGRGAGPNLLGQAFGFASLIFMAAAVSAVYARMRGQMPYRAARRGRDGAS